MVKPNPIDDINAANGLNDWIGVEYRHRMDNQQIESFTTTNQPKCTEQLSNVKSHLPFQRNQWDLPFRWCYTIAIGLTPFYWRMNTSTIYQLEPVVRHLRRNNKNKILVYLRARCSYGTDTQHTHAEACTWFIYMNGCIDSKPNITSSDGTGTWLCDHLLVYLLFLRSNKSVCNAFTFERYVVVVWCLRVQHCTQTHVVTSVVLINARNRTIHAVSETNDTWIWLQLKPASYLLCVDSVYNNNMKMIWDADDSDGIERDA